MLTEPENDKQLQAALEKYFASNPAAYNWLIEFRQLCHAIDDLVDIPERRSNAQYFGIVCNLFVEIMSHDFYSSRRGKLYAIVKSCMHQFFHSVNWETSTDKWESTWADVSRCCYNQMVVAVVDIVVLETTGNYIAAFDAAQEVSKLAVAKSYYNHHLPDGKPI